MPAQVVASHCDTLGGVCTNVVDEQRHIRAIRGVTDERAREITLAAILSRDVGYAARLFLLFERARRATVLQSSDCIGCCHKMHRKGTDDVGYQ